MSHVDRQTWLETASIGSNMMVDRAGLASDPEKNLPVDEQLTNRTVQSFAWRDTNVTVKDRQTKAPKTILQRINGSIRPGELLALMGPSGSGKTTLLNVLAQRQATTGATETGDISVNGGPIDSQTFRQISCYVEQEDPLVGSLTVEETLQFAAKLSLPKSVDGSGRWQRVQTLLRAFGLQKQAQVLVGTPIRKGISGGQKRRLSVASQLITGPTILFLDEPTSGLDSAASFEVMTYVKKIARKYNIMVVASIHQPSTSTYQIFDKLLLLSQGSTVYYGRVDGVRQFFESRDHHMPKYVNPAEFLLDLVSSDFSPDLAEASNRVKRLHYTWDSSIDNKRALEDIASVSETDLMNTAIVPREPANPLMVLLALIQRSFIKSYRDIVAYGIRVAMYMGLAIMMGTVWLRLDTNQSNIQSFINAIFFGGAFMSFMAVAYIPAFLEDRSIYVKERHNGLYGPTLFMIANFITGLPYLFLITLLFSIIAYWLCNFRPSGPGFGIWVMWLFLDLIAAESLVVLLSSLVPIFVVALAATAFANGLWMSVGGFMVAPDTLNVFWRYVFHYIDYQAYVFQGMMVNEFSERIYDCGDGCHCMYPSKLQDQCQIDGKAVLSAYGYPEGRTGRWVGYMMLIILGYRLLGWLTLYLRRT